jgi:hypothetical protein
MIELWDWAKENPGLAGGLAYLIAAVAVVCGARLLVFLVTAVRCVLLERRFERQYQRLAELSAEVNRRGQDEHHWKRLYQELSPLSEPDRRRWVKALQQQG